MSNVTDSIELLACIERTDLAAMSDAELHNLLALQYVIALARTEKAKRNVIADSLAAQTEYNKMQAEKQEIAADISKVHALPEWKDIIGLIELYRYADRRNDTIKARRLEEMVYNILAKHQIDNMRVFAHLVNQ